MPIYPYSLSQLTKSLNYSLTFDFNSIVKQKLDIRPLIGNEHESKGLHYFGTNSFMSYFASPSHLLNFCMIVGVIYTSQK